MLDFYDSVSGKWNTNPRYKEILRLDEMLTEAQIPHVLTPWLDGWQIWYPVKCDDVSESCVMDVIQNYASYGSDSDLLEIMGLLTPDEEQIDLVCGELTAEEVFERIHKHHAGEWDNYIKSLCSTTAEEIPNDTTMNTTTPMTPEEFANKMRNAYKIYYEEQDDEEEVHSAMDSIMCSLLRQLGYGEGIDIFLSTPKWYS